MTRFLSRLMFLLSAAAVAMLIIGLVAIAGYWSVRTTLLAEAEADAGAWLATMLQTQGGDMRRIAENALATADSAGAWAGADAVAVIETDSVRIGTAEAASPDALLTELRTTVGADGAGLLATPNGAYARQVGSSIFQPRLIEWVLLPAAEGGGLRIALRYGQADSAMAMLLKYNQNILFHSGIALITFFSFMAGYTYRARQVAEEDARMRYYAFHDELTGLPNRKHFDEMLNDTFVELDPAKPVALMVIDLDGFKAVNDTLGHPVGDELLKAVATRLSEALRQGDFLARLSGDEFAILVRTIDDLSELGPLAKRLRDTIEAPFTLSGNKASVGCSIGIAVAPHDAATPSDLMRNADFALYSAKANGRRTWRFFDPGMTREQENRRVIESGLRLALDKKLFRLAYQPQVDLASGRVAGYEALLRWEMPNGNQVPAAAFMAVAEESGLIVPIGEWVIAQAIADLARLPVPLTVAINLSAAQLKRGGIDRLIADCLTRNAVAPDRLEVEVNESLAGRNEANAFAMLERIHAIGVAIVMDKFGMGMSSVGMLSRYPFNKIKLARTIIEPAGSDDKARGVLAAMCSLGRSLGLTVSGEGIETAAHADILRSVGCVRGQGFFFGYPEPIETVLASLRTAAAA